MKQWKIKTQNYHQKLNRRIASRIAEQFKTQDLSKSGNLKVVYLSFNRLHDSWTCGFKFVTRGFELVTREFEPVGRGFELVTRKIELITHKTELVTRGFELALLNFN